MCCISYVSFLHTIWLAHMYLAWCTATTNFVGPTLAQRGSCRLHVEPMWAQGALLSGYVIPPFWSLGLIHGSRCAPIKRFREVMNTFTRCPWSRLCSHDVNLLRMLWLPPCGGHQLRCHPWLTMRETTNSKVLTFLMIDRFLTLTSQKLFVQKITVSQIP